MATEATTVVAGLAILSLLLLGGAAWWGRWPVWVVGLLAGAAAIIAAFLFRDPPREPPVGFDLVVAPTDGCVASVHTVHGVADYAVTQGDGSLTGISTGRVRVLLRYDNRRGVIRVRDLQLQMGLDASLDARYGTPFPYDGTDGENGFTVRAYRHAEQQLNKYKGI